MVLLSGLIGALIGALATTTFNIWKIGRDELSARCDELCRAVIEIADLASSYWSTAYTASDLTQARILEAALAGKQYLIDNLWGSLRDRLSGADVDFVDRALSDLADAATGGCFSVAGRPADPSRVRAAPYVAAKLVVSLRDAHRRTIPLAKMSTYYWSERGSRE